MVFISDVKNNRVVQSGTSVQPLLYRTFLENEPVPAGLAIDSLGNVFLAHFSFNIIKKIDPSGQVSNYAGANESPLFGRDGYRTQALFHSPYALVIDSDDNIYGSPLV